MQKAFMLVFGWLLRGSQIKFVVFTIVALLFTFVMSFVVPEIVGFISPSALSSAFLSVDPKIWYFLNLFNITGGLPLLISAYVARFIIRRLPFIG